jgi:hypothetical protein
MDTEEMRRWTKRKQFVRKRGWLNRLDPVSIGSLYYCTKEMVPWMNVRAYVQ